MPKPKTNIQFVNGLLQNGGLLAEVFIIDAIEKQAKVVADIPDDQIAKMFANHIISGAAWKETAVKLLEAIQKRGA